MDITALARKSRDKAVDRVTREEIAAQAGTGLLTPDMARQKVAADVSTALKTLGVKLRSGFVILKDQYAKVRSASRPEDAIPFLEPGFFAARETALAALAAHDDEDMDLQEAWDISLEDLSRAHDLVADLFQEQRYEDASAALLCLVSLAPEVSELSMALGHAEYHCGRLDNAVRCYAGSYLCDTSNPKPLVHAAFCLLKNGSRDEALEFLEKAEGANGDAGDLQVAAEIAQLRQQGEKS